MDREQLGKCHHGIFPGVVDRKRRMAQPSASTTNGGRAGLIPRWDPRFRDALPPTTRASGCGRIKSGATKASNVERSDRLTNIFGASRKTHLRRSKRSRLVRRAGRVSDPALASR